LLAHVLTMTTFQIVCGGSVLGFRDFTLFWELLMLQMILVRP
jgi:hypothetical protein